MKIMRVVEVGLIADKERLEYSLEEIINDKELDPTERVNKIKSILLELTQIMNATQLWSSYIQGLNNNNKDEENIEK
jgi:hypothetical protein|tara:strand:+ start:139 stop:369 length:231 start_codon:yes stop_codon:yes gene_type:complete